jgi:hypothetical protein
LPQLLQSLLDLDLKIVNHRSWHQRHASDDKDIIWMWNDIYVIDGKPSSERYCEASVDESTNCRSTEIKEFIEGSLHDQTVRFGVLPNRTRPRRISKYLFRVPFICVGCTDCSDTMVSYNRCREKRCNIETSD